MATAAAVGAWGAVASAAVGAGAAVYGASEASRTASEAAKLAKETANFEKGRIEKQEALIADEQRKQDKISAERADRQNQRELLSDTGEEGVTSLLV